MGNNQNTESRIIVLTGIPGVGKTQLIEITKEYGELTGKKIGSVSMSELFMRAAKELNIPNERMPFATEPVQRALRTNLMKACGYEIMKYIDNGVNNIIVDTPLVLVNHNGMIETTFRLDSFFDLRRESPRGGYGINKVVCLIESTKEIQQNLNKKAYEPHPTNTNLLLYWIALEVNRSLDLAEISNLNLLVTARKHAETTLIKLLEDDEPPIVYMAYPISNIRNDAEAQEKVDKFRERLQEYAVVINPIKSEDIKAETKIGRSYIIYRDLRWFVRSADCVIAYFPKPIESAGVKKELDEAVNFGKFVFVVGLEPNGKEASPFAQMAEKKGIFRNEDDFFDKVMKANTKSALERFRKRVTDGKTSRILPRYANIVRQIRSGQRTLLLK